MFDPIRNSSFGIRYSILMWLVLGLMLIPASAQETQGKFKRLILKDGSYELITQYEIRGDRVRYYSSERNDWEELPYALVDWPATEKFAEQAAHQSSERKTEEPDETAAERREEEAHQPPVAPGLRLPSSFGVYLLDLYQNMPELNRLVQNGADLNKNTKGNILRGVINPISGPRQTVELKGLHAGIQSHALSPSIYLSIDPEDPLTGYDSRTAKDHLCIVRCREKNGNRVVVAISIALYGKMKQQADYVETKVEPVSEYWVKIIPGSPLKPGEYALVEFDDKAGMNAFVWDFGVDPAAPPNPATMRSNPGKSEPVLIQKSPKKTNP